MPDESPSILAEIISNFDYAMAYWRPIYAEGEKDIRYEIEGPWDPDEITARKGRVTLSLDEFGQYLNQICNEFRQNKRAVKVNPRGDGATDETARYRAAMIREIEYQSRAQQAYVTAGEDMVRRSFGFFKLKTEFEPGSFRRCLRVGRIQNPHVIYLDPDAKEADWSDCGWGFEIERMRERAFRKRFGNKAKVISFTDEHVSLAPGWITTGDDGKHVQVASYWRLDTKTRPLYLLANGQELNPSEDQAVQVVKVPKSQDFPLGKAAILDGYPIPIIDERDDNEKTVTQYVTNGVEIIEENPSDFDEIPIIPMFGREVWVSTGGASSRKFLSAVRLARDAYKAYCYARSAAVERLSMDPKTPYEGWEGQFATQTNFATVNQTPQGYVEFKPAVDPVSGASVWDKPSRNLTEPQINQYEVAAESFRRAIQAAMGGSPLPTSAQRQNQKSGIALERMEQSADQGNFHFIDNFDIALERAGRMMDRALDIVYDTPREVGLRSETDEYSTMKINERDPQTGDPIGFHTGRGDHGVTISTGPSYQSQRDAADDFLDKLSQNEVVFPRIADLVVKLKNLGPIGDEIAKRLAPPDGGSVPPEVAAQVQAAQQQIGEMQAEIERLKAGDEIKRYTVDEQEKTKRVLGLIKVDQQDAENLLEKMLGVLQSHTQRFDDLSQQVAQREHESASSEAERAHQASMAQQAQEAAAQQGAAQA